MNRSTRAALVASLIVIAAGCSSSGSQDPYEIVRKALATPWAQVQVNVGASVKSAGATFSLDPSSIQFNVDSMAGKGSVHVALPAAAMGANPASLAALGITGSTVDFDALYDGQAFYAKSPILKPVITMIMATSGDLPEGDLTAWLRLATRGDLDLLAAAMASGEAPTPPPLGSFDAATLQKTLTDSGLTLKFVATDKRNGTDADHVSVAIDVNKALDSPLFDSARRDQINQIKEAARNGTASADLWADHASGKLTEVDLHLAATGAEAGSFDVAVTLNPLPAGTSFDAPAGAVDVPARTLLGQILKMVGQGLQQ